MGLYKYILAGCEMYVYILCDRNGFGVNEVSGKLGSSKLSKVIGDFNTAICNGKFW